MSTRTLNPVSTKWSATHHGHQLKVTGQVTFPTTGYTVTLKKATPQGVNPGILLLEMQVKNPTGTVADHVTHETVTFSEETQAHYTEVTILPEDVTIQVK